MWSIWLDNNVTYNHDLSHSSAHFCVNLHDNQSNNNHWKPKEAGWCSNVHSFICSVLIFPACIFKLQNVQMCASDLLRQNVGSVLCPESYLTWIVLLWEETGVKWERNTPVACLFLSAAVCVWNICILHSCKKRSLLHNCCNKCWVLLSCFRIKYKYLLHIKICSIFIITYCWRAFTCDWGVSF